MLTITASRTFQTSETTRLKTNRYIPEDFKVQKYVPQRSHYLKFQSLPKKKIPTSHKCSIRKSLLFAGGITLKTDINLEHNTQRPSALNVVLHTLIPTGLRVKRTTKLPEACDNY
jgi:hypothetical protein